MGTQPNCKENKKAGELLVELCKMYPKMVIAVTFNDKIESKLVAGQFKKAFIVGIQKEGSNDIALARTDKNLFNALLSVKADLSYQDFMKDDKHHSPVI
jgi:hypothetical protein